MRFIADFHIHSHYSIATSKLLVPEYLAFWGGVKGINMIGTGDCIHPGWLNELRQKLEPEGNGLFKLQDSYKLSGTEQPFDFAAAQEPRFMLTTEISSIYKKNGKVRKVHNVIAFPSFKAAAKLQAKLDKMGNISSDGRPILGLDAKLLLEMALECSSKTIFIPAHIWTPWFSVLGSKSGFDTIEECFEELTEHIYAVETGLSSDPPMNWSCSFLDRFKLLSNSDAHSPEKLGRNANIFDCELSYDGIYTALKKDKGLVGTIDLHPQEGKYHFDGHRKCGVCWNPLQTLQHEGACPQCGKPVTRGVLYRVAELADRSDIEAAANRKQFFQITPLPELLAEINKCKSGTKKVKQQYIELVQKFGPELHLLLDTDLEQIRDSGNELLAEGIRRLRDRRVHIEEGYDGEFGRIKVFQEVEIDSFGGDSLFIDQATEPQEAAAMPLISFDIKQFQALKKCVVLSQEKQATKTNEKVITAQQKEAIEHGEGVCSVIAGPGSGKTHILTERIKYCIAQGVAAEKILALTFSNKAAQEISERLQAAKSEHVVVTTFHAFGLSVLKEEYEVLGRSEEFFIIDQEERLALIMRAADCKANQARKWLRQIESVKQGITELEKWSDLEHIYNSYENALLENNLFDLSCLIEKPVRLFKEKKTVLHKWRQRFSWLLVDEFQDINARQYQLLTLMAGDGNPNLFVIGDPDQSIYGFRGSDLRFMSEIVDQYPEIKQLRLDKSYRCPGNVLQAAGQVLGKKQFLAGTDDSFVINTQECSSAKSEADWVAAQIEAMVGGVRSFSINSGISDGTTIDDINGFNDFAVLCRTSAMFGLFEEAFQNHGIPWQKAGTSPFFKEEPFVHFLHQVKKAAFPDQQQTERADEKLSTRVQEKINLVTLYEEFLAEQIDDPQIDRKARDLFARYGNQYALFFEALATRQGLDEHDTRAEAVSLLTLHASKGLEFKAVFLPGCEKGLLPFELFGKKSKAELAEEERLFYVGITRTKKYLTLSHAKRRNLRGRELHPQASPFLLRIKDELLSRQKRTPKSKKESTDSGQLNLFDE